MQSWPYRFWVSAVSIANDAHPYGKGYLLSRSGWGSVEKTVLTALHLSLFLPLRRYVESAVPVQSDELTEIIARAQRNDQRAYEQIYNRFADPLYRYLYVRCNDATLAEEVLGDLWLRVVQYLPHFRIPEHGADQAFASWLYRIARNLSIDAQRNDHRRAYGIPETMISPEPEMDQYVLAQDEQRALKAALNALTVEQREVILLRFREDHTSAEVATLTGRTESAVKALQHRALGALARAMGIQRQREGNPC